MAKYLERTITPDIPRVSKNFKALLVTGPRQVGKTTLLKRTAEQARQLVDLSDETDRIFAKTDPKGFLDTYPPPVFIDEIQYAPELLSYIKMMVDKSDKPGQIWMTGSQQFELMEYASDSLAGRIAIVELQGLSIYEREGLGLKQKPFLPSNAPSRTLTHRNVKETFKIIWQGSFPAVIEADAKNRKYFYDSYVKTYLERDVRKIINVRDETAFLTFIKVIAARTAQELNMEDIAKDVGISSNTVKNWLSVLRTSGLIYMLRPFSKNITKRLTKTPKLYFLDTGLAAYLAGWTTPEALETGISAGAFFETFAISEILKSYWHNGENPDLYFYRDSDKKEIDLLIYQDNKYYPIEIKKHSTPNKNDIASFATFEKASNAIVGRGCVLCLTPEPQPLSPTTAAISIWAI
jgi:predicted AAA+ superfamily ATPase